MWNIERTSRKTVSLIACLFVLLTSVFSSVQAQPLETFRVAYVKTTPQPALLFVASAQGYFKAEGLVVEHVAAATGKHALDAVLAGQADIAAVAETPIVNAVLENKNIAVLAGIFKSDRSEAILGRKDAGIQGATDLKGKRIGLTRGTSQEFFFDTFLTWHKVPKDSLSVVDMKPDDYTRAFLQGRVDAIVTAIPRAPRLKGELGDKVIVFYGTGFYSETYNLVTTGEKASQAKSQLRRFLMALIKAEQYSQQHPDKALALVAQTIGTNEELMRGIWSDLNLRISLDQSLIVNLEHQARWAMRNNKTAQRNMPEFNRWLADDILRETAPERVTHYHRRKREH